MHHDETARVAVELRIVPPRLVETVIDCVQPVNLRRRGEVFSNSPPFLRNRLPELFLPFYSGVEAISPV